MRSVVAHIVSCILLVGISLMTSCREDEVIILAEYERLPLGDNSRSDYFENGYYVRNLYAEKNPNVVKELGDVGNDVQIYGSKMYAVINCSHKVEVLDAHSCQRLGQVDIPNCRYIAFDKGYAYVSAYVGPVGIDPNAQLGAVFQVDTATLEITAEVTVGYQPDELVIQDGLIYVANSGGYRKPNYDNTVSVIDIETMTQIRKIPVGINLHRIRADKYGKLWVSSRGDYEKIPSRLFVLEKDKRTNRMEVRDTLNVSCSEMDICGDSLYLYSVEWSNISQENNVTYGIIDVRTGELISNSFIKDGTETDIEIPYGLKVNPETGDVYVTDAKNYVSSGNLHCYGRDGIRKWSVRTGDIPAHMAFLYKNK
ncbi:MAG: hypothetical protein BHV68_15465 [Bacteroidales bacterium 43_8]|nr:MAG: hypothetical protein BHV68_15465 [Bacteroidales bacterium 43_8]